MYSHTPTRIGAIVVVAGALAGIGVTTAAVGPSGVHIRADLKVTAGPPPSCNAAGICMINNSGTGRMTHFGNLTFTTAIIADDSQPPCGTSSQWVNRIVRTIHTTRGSVVLHEAGLQCPEPGVGPRVAPSAPSTAPTAPAPFAGATGHGTDVAYPVGDTAAPTGTITLAK